MRSMEDALIDGLLNYLTAHSVAVSEGAAIHLEENISAAPHDQALSPRQVEIPSESAQVAIQPSNVQSLHVAHVEVEVEPPPSDTQTQSQPRAEQVPEEGKEAEEEEIQSAAAANSARDVKGSHITECRDLNEQLRDGLTNDAVQSNKQTN